MRVFCKCLNVCVNVEPITNVASHETMLTTSHETTLSSHDAKFSSHEAAGILRNNAALLAASNNETMTTGLSHETSRASHETTTMLPSHETTLQRVDVETLGLSDDELVDQFFTGRHKLTAVPLSAGRDRKIERLPIFVGKRVVDSWDIITCLLCDADLYAATLFAPDRALINMDLIKTEAEIAECRRAPEYSPAFQILLPKMRHSSDKRGIRWPGSHSHPIAGPINESLTECLRAEQRDMDDRIRRFIDREHAKFEQFKAKAKSDRLILFAYATDRSIQGQPLSLGAGGAVLTGTVVNLSGDEEEEENDSAVPSSPLSLHSDGGHSPVTPLYSNEAPPDPTGCGVGGGVTVAVAERGVDNGGQQRRSNSTSLLTWKRKRHSGGSGRTPTLSAHSEEQQDVFNLEEHDLRGFGVVGGGGSLAADDDTAGAVEIQDLSSSEYRNVVVDVPFSTVAVRTKHQNLCRSLPVAIKNSPVSRRLPSVGGAASPDDDQSERAEGDDVIDDDSDAPRGPIRIDGGADLAQSMMALARSMRPRDDPEALFGERPHRRRFKSSADAAAPSIGGPTTCQTTGTQKARVIIFNNTNSNQSSRAATTMMLGGAQQESRDSDESRDDSVFDESGRDAGHCGDAGGRNGGGGS